MKIIYVDSPKWGMKEILVDNRNLKLVNRYNWRIYRNKKTFYAITGVKVIGEDGVCLKTTISMHRLILRLKTGDKRQGDHKNHNGLDNREINLRIANQSQSSANRNSHSGSSSKFLGVCLYRKLNKWHSQIKKDKKLVHLGYFNNEEDAARAYDKAAKKLHGKFANLNFK